MTENELDYWIKLIKSNSCKKHVLYLITLHRNIRIFQDNLELFEKNYEFSGEKMNKIIWNYLNLLKKPLHIEKDIFKNIENEDVFQHFQNMKAQRQFL